MELRNQPPSSQPLTAPVHPPERVTGPPELHHSEGRYLLDPVLVNELIKLSSKLKQQILHIIVLGIVVA